MLDSETRIDSLHLERLHTLVYNYSLVHFQRSKVDTAQFRLALWPGILSTVRSSPEMQKLRENKATIVYRYSDQLGQPIIRLVIKPEHYQ
jgi:hypothetical protein